MGAFFIEDPAGREFDLLLLRAEGQGHPTLALQALAGVPLEPPPDRRVVERACATTSSPWRTVLGQATMVVQNVVRV